MQTFQNSDQLYQVLDPFFQRLSENPEIVESLVAGNFVLRFRYTEPEGQVTFDLREKPLRWFFGDTDLSPDLEMIQSADTAHEFWLGRLNITGAIARRRVVARGPISKALKLLPAIKPAFPIYAEVLREEGREDLIPSERQSPRWRFQISSLVNRFRGRLSGIRLRPVSIDYAQLNSHLIPLTESPSPQQTEFRKQCLPETEATLQVEMLERMQVIRAFEQTLARAFASGNIPTEAIHLSVGQEAVAVGACFALRADDYLATTHRGHGHMLGKGADLDGMMAEMFGKATGLCCGKGGSMHVTEAAVGAIGANGIVGASPLIAAGAAHSALLRQSDQVAVAFMGDGATNQGMFHEGLNFAAVLKLPAIFVVENNLYGEFTPQSDHMCLDRIADRAASYGIPGIRVDGNDVWAVYQAMTEAVMRARAGGGPTLLECLTYRWHGHMEGESVDYRPAAELTEWKKNCPIANLKAELSEKKILTTDETEQIAQRALANVDTALNKALASPEPELAQLKTDVFSPDPSYLYRPASNGDSCEREISCSTAIFEALSEELSRDESVYLLGEDVSTGGYFAVTAGLSTEFGSKRIVDTPISEYAIVGSAVGAAMTGRRPVAEILFSDFLTTCMDPLVNQAAKLRYMSGGQYSLPLVVRTPGGAGLGMAAQHSQSLEALLAGIPGLIILAPATPCDAKGLLKAAIRSNNPVVFFENKLLYASTGPVPIADYIVPIGVAEEKRQGRDATIVSIGAALPKSLEAAEELSSTGIEVEIIDVRSIVPLDLETIVRSVVKTGRLITVEEAPVVHGFGSEIVAQVTQVAHAALRSSPRRVGAEVVPIPYNNTLENAALPDADRIRQAVLQTL
jgi:2-oxoisovalerate dehydrogenase E1 component